MIRYTRWLTRLSCGCEVRLFPDTPRVGSFVTCTSHGTVWIVSTENLAKQGSDKVDSKTSATSRSEGTEVDINTFAKLAKKAKPAERVTTTRAGRPSANPEDNPAYALLRRSANNADDGDDGLWVGQGVFIDMEDATDDDRKEVRAFIGKAARDLGCRYRVRFTETDGHTGVTFWAMEAAPLAQCLACGKDVPVTARGQLRTHGPRNNRCIGSGTEVEVPDELDMPETASV